MSRRDYHREYYRKKAERRRQQRMDSHARTGRYERKPIFVVANLWLRTPPPGES